MKHRSFLVPAIPCVLLVLSLLLSTDCTFSHDGEEQGLIMPVVQVDGVRYVLQPVSTQHGGNGSDDALGTTASKTDE